ncbi:hypothetical protein EDC01DRAFT_631735 [Geopyxis carbonaria]|nr:hypothetical protein EDC01DRAFT_631735 [Geopyxis carbonaria]
MHPPARLPPQQVAQEVVQLRCYLVGRTTWTAGWITCVRPAGGPSIPGYVDYMSGCSFGCRATCYFSVARQISPLSQPGGGPARKGGRSRIPAAPPGILPRAPPPARSRGIDENWAVTFYPVNKTLNARPPAAAEEPQPAAPTTPRTTTKVASSPPSTPSTHPSAPPRAAATPASWRLRRRTATPTSQFISASTEKIKKQKNNTLRGDPRLSNYQRLIKCFTGERTPFDS